MRAFAISVLLILCWLPAFAGHPTGVRAEYIGGTRADIPNNNNGDIEVVDNVYFVFMSKKTQIKIPYERINLLEYGQKSEPPLP